MSQFDEKEDETPVTREDTAHNLPLGWVILFIGLILWGVYYFVSYTPAVSGWTQGGALVETMKGE